MSTKAKETKKSLVSHVLSLPIFWAGVCIVVLGGGILLHSGRAEAAMDENIHYAEMIENYNGVCEGIKKLREYEDIIQIHRDNICMSSNKLIGYLMAIDMDINVQTLAQGQTVVRRIYEETIQPELESGNYDKMLESIKVLRQRHPEELDYNRIDGLLDDISKVNTSLKEEKVYYNSLISSYDELVTKYQPVFDTVRYTPRAYDRY